MNRRRIIAITGGIGSGKSVVSKIVERMGFAVYDCDSRAKALMDSDPTIGEAIEREICRSVVSDSGIDRKALGEIVFADSQALAALNRIVHGAVVHDFDSWKLDLPTAFVETAILYTSGLDRHVTEVWEVTAPTDIRIERVRLRNPWLSEAHIRQRIESQMCEERFPKHATTRRIVNDNRSAIIPQIESLLSV